MNPKPFHSAFLPELNSHQIHFEQYGNSSGEVIVTTHGGPGDHVKPRHISNYDLDKYHVIAFDQRGCGQSLPLGKIDDNSLQTTISDMERLRQHLKINRWYVAGGSWGSTIALAYAEAHPEYVKGLLLYSIFLGRKLDEEWSFSKDDGITHIFPDVAETRQVFLSKFGATPNNAAKHLLNLIQTQPEHANEIAAGVMNWEGNLMSAQSDVKYLEAEDVGVEDIASVKIFLHYEANGFFLSDNQLLNNISNIKNIPTLIVHGRYDLLCPLEGAWEIKKNVSNVDLIILPTSNHRLTAEGELARRLAITNFLLQN